MLHPRAAIEVEIFIDLRLLLSPCRLVDRELDTLVPVRHHLRHEGAVLRRDVGIVEGDEILEAHHLFIETDPNVHLSQLHVAHAVIDVEESGLGCLKVRRTLREPWHEQPTIIPSLDERVDRVTVNAYGRDDDFTSVVLEYLGLVVRHGATRHGLFERIARIFDPQRDVAYAIAVRMHVLRDLAFRPERRGEQEPDLVLLK